MNKKAGGTDVARFYDSTAADYHRMYQRENLNSLEYYPANYFRLGVSSIPTERIESGIKLLAEAVREQLKRG